MRRLALLALLVAAPLLAQPSKSPLSRGLADALYVKLAGGNVVAGLTTFTNVTITGTCTGCTTGAVPTTRLISTTSPLGGGGDLSADRTLTCTLCIVSGGALGTPSSGTGTNLTGIPESGVTNLTTDLAGKQATGNYITALTTDVTASGPGSVAATIASGAVTLAKMANMATASLIYRKTAGSGAPEVNTLATLKSDLAYAFSDIAGAFTLAQFPTIATNTVLVNATSGTAVPTAQTVGTCSGSGSALIWTTNSGFGCNTAVVASTVTTNANLTGPITSVGNATSIASQTGTGTKFVVDTSPTIITPTITTSINVPLIKPPSNSTTAIQITKADGSTFVVDVDTTNNRVGVGTNAPATNLHVENGASGATVSGTGLQIAAENAGDAGFSVWNPNANIGRLTFNTVAASLEAKVEWDHANLNLNIGTASASGGQVVLKAGNNVTAATIGAATAVFTGSIAPSQTAGLIGTTTNNAANVGSVGEFVSASVATGSSVTLSTGTVANVTSVSLTAGDWDCEGTIDYALGATTSLSNIQNGISTTSATMGAQGTFSDYESPAGVPGTAFDLAWVTPTVRQLISGTTTVYLVARGNFTVSTLKAYGDLRCRRMR